MVYIFAFIGFVIGFAVGLGVINVMLRDKSVAEIKAIKSYKWTYGLAVWVFAFIGGWAGFWIHNNYFL